MTRRAEVLSQWEDEMIEIAYGLEEFTIRQVADLAGGGDSRYRHASDILKIRFDRGELIKVQEAKQHYPIIYRWAPE